MDWAQAPVTMVSVPWVKDTRAEDVLEPGGLSSAPKAKPVTRLLRSIQILGSSSAVLSRGQRARAGSADARIEPAPLGRASILRCSVARADVFLVDDRLASPAPLVRSHPRRPAGGVKAPCPSCRTSPSTSSARGADPGPAARARAARQPVPAALGRSADRAAPGKRVAGAAPARQADRDRARGRALPRAPPDDRRPAALERAGRQARRAPSVSPRSISRTAR